MTIRWFMTIFIFSGMLHTDIINLHKPKITVGSGLTCHYPPERLNQAVQEHNTLYLTTDAVFPPIEITNPQVQLIGGLADCGDWKQHRNNSQKSIISGFHRHRPVTIKQPELPGAINSNIQLKKIRIINGRADSGGGLEITGPTKIHLEDTVIEHNTATHHGGGIALKGDSVKLQIINSLIQFNQSEGMGGGVSCQGNHHIKIDAKGTVNTNQAPLADNYLLDENCFIKINQAD